MPFYKNMVPAGDSALLVTFEQTISLQTSRKVYQFLTALQQAKTEGILDLVPGYASVLIHYNPQVISFDALRNRVKTISPDTETAETNGRHLVIPVHYGGSHGPDLARAAASCHMSEEELITIHSQREYTVYMLGFMPGFPYLGELDDRIAVPRLDHPRQSIPAGSVGIGGNQTGIYPSDSPGGWNLIGQTPLNLYRPEAENPFLIEAGDFIRFHPVDEEEFLRLRQEGE